MTKMIKKQLPQKSCSINGCGGKHKARGLCVKHYNRFMAHGTTDCPSPLYNTPEEAFEARTVRDPKTGCLNWTGYTNRGGYGTIGVDGKMTLTHRYLWQRKNGPIPMGMFICHHCDNPPCCEESHLFLGTNADNMKDRNAKGRQAKLKGSQNGQSKLTESDIPMIRSDTRLHRTIAAEYGVTRPLIGMIKARKAWRHV